MRLNVAVAARAGASGAGSGEGQKTPNSLTIQYLVCESGQKLAQLVHFLQVRRAAARGAPIRQVESVSAAPTLRRRCVIVSRDIRLPREC